MRLKGGLWVLALLIFALYPVVVTNPAYMTIAIYTLIYMSCATSWNITFSKKASKVMCDTWSSTISSFANGTRMRSNLARTAFLSCRRRVPFWSWTSSSFGRLMAIVFEPTFAAGLAL